MKAGLRRLTQIFQRGGRRFSLSANGVGGEGRGEVARSQFQDRPLFGQSVPVFQFNLDHFTVTVEARILQTQ